MKIAILSTPWISVPPKGYGGIELVVSNLTEELVKKGHDVMLFATGDSKTSANLRFYYKKNLGNDLFLKKNPYYLLNHLHAFFKIIKKEKFDIIHNNAQYIPQFFLDIQNTPFINTLHGAFYKNLIAPSGLNEEKRKILLKFKSHPYVSISNNQRIGLPELNYIKTIYNGIKPEEFKIQTNKGNYLAWIGRVTPNKGLDIVIKVAKKVGLPLKISAFIDSGDKDYFDNKIKPFLNDKNIEFVGEIKNPEEKSDFLGNAKAFLFPIRWHEPFGIVMVEAMACGTPVIAFNKGSVPEVIEDKKTGFIVETEKEMINAVKKIDSIDRKYCHQYAISKFSVEKMTNDYLEAYQIAINQFKNRKIL